jgi:2-polyprenyl-3-methyl-5-hydroxy-6-metoxy-1,4-benzoquinol methylase
MNRLRTLTAFLRYFPTMAVHVAVRRLTANGRWRPGAEQTAQWYDVSFLVWRHWKRHYSLSHYYFLWAVIADRLVLSGHRSVLDLGCGPGQFACLLKDRGINQYTGLDFSPARIAYARTICPGFDFRVEDLFESRAFSLVDYDCVTATEVLEHIEGDLDLLACIKPRTRVLASVPNFSSAGHVRVFSTSGEVHQRYGHILENLRVDPLAGPGGQKTYFVIDGYRA